MENMKNIQLSPDKSLQSWGNIRRLIKDWCKNNQDDMTEYISMLEEKI